MHGRLLEIREPGQSKAGPVSKMPTRKKTRSIFHERRTLILEADLSTQKLRKEICPLKEKSQSP